MSVTELTTTGRNASEFYFGQTTDIDLLSEDFGEMGRRILLSATRFVLREYACDRLPIIKAAGVDYQDNQFGDRIFAELNYANEWLTTIAGRFVNGEIQWSVYAD